MFVSRGASVFVVECLAEIAHIKHEKDEKK